MMYMLVMCIAMAQTPIVGEHAYEDYLRQEAMKKEQQTEPLGIWEQILEAIKILFGGDISSDIDLANEGTSGPSAATGDQVRWLATLLQSGLTMDAYTFSLAIIDSCHGVMEDP